MGVGNLPSHNHSVNTVSGAGTSKDPANQLLATTTGASVTGAPNIYASAQPNSTLAANAISSTGGNQPVDIRSPYLTFNWIIALVGIYPSRD